MIRYFCNQPPKDKPLDTVDYVVGIICLIIILANVIGTVYEPFGGKRKDFLSRFLVGFSIRYNWRKLVAPVARGQDPRLKRLKGIHGMRALSIGLVIMAHSILACVAFIDNPIYFEKLYKTSALKVIFNGMTIMQTFLVMSGFLLVYNSLLHAEKSKITFMTFPKYILLRWLRLTPAYAVYLGLTITWMRYLTDGPLWQEVIGNEVRDCKKYWWTNLLYINNYFDDSQCMQHTWYIATDTQLYCVGALVYVLCSTPRSRKIVLPLLFVAGLIIPGVITYMLNLDGTLIASPEAIHSLFLNEPTFNYTYRRGHTNLAGYTIGLSVGYLVYRWQKNGVDMTRFRQQMIVGFVLASFLTALPFYLIVEAPLSNMIKLLISGSRNKDGDNKETVKEENPKKMLSDSEILAIEKIVPLKTLREILSDDRKYESSRV
ncbi:hypothetical protein HF086_003596 [Spodoptera exigua]|uniref:Acyltransferase 3 domain-containing protein n=1 Tax=Spodoptera exigua TaxID=7107 RepID=A0A922SIQ2_SPOEX|nr:hypothetical protein HF086_003596 [Spodoptera exigua]